MTEQTRKPGPACRLKTACALLLGLRPHDLRAAGSFMARMYPDQRWLTRVCRFALWAVAQAFGAIPTALGRARFQRPVAKTPIWLAEGNPLANHPWAGSGQEALPDRVDAVVIGAGFTGASCAYHWSKQKEGGRLVVLEMGDPASGASGRNEGLVVMGRYFTMVRDTVRPYLDRVRKDMTPAERHQLASQFAGVYARSAYKNAALIEETIRSEGYECDYVRNGWIQAMDEGGQKGLEESIQAGAEAGLDDWGSLSVAETLERGGMRVAHPSGFSRQAACFHPAKWVWSLLQTALRKTDIELFTRTRVEEVADDGEEGYVVRTDRGTMRARSVVNATESYTALLHRQYRDILWPVQTQAAFGLGGPEGVRAGIGLSGGLGFFGRHKGPDGDGVIFGSDATRVPHHRAGSNRPSRFITKVLVGELYRYFGDGDVAVTNEWSGTPGFTVDEYPVVGRLDGKRQYIIGGMCGSGTAVSFNGARHVVQQILELDGSDDYPEAYFAPTRLLDPANHPWPKLTKGGDSDGPERTVGRNQSGDSDSGTTHGSGE